MELIQTAYEIVLTYECMLDAELEAMIQKLEYQRNKEITDQIIL